MQGALIGLLGIFIGIILSEYFRRNSRIEVYSKEIFKKRLELYDQLFEIIAEARDLAPDIIDNKVYTKEKRIELWSEIIFKLADFLDENELYINNRVAEHCMFMLIGVEDFYYEKHDRKEQLAQEFRYDCLDAIRMLKEETGLKAMDNMFKAVLRPRYNSKYIKDIKEIEAKLEARYGTRK